MYEYKRRLVDAKLLLGEFDYTKTGGLSPKFFWDRRTFLDCRGDLYIYPQNVTLGPHVKIITYSHSFDKGELGPDIQKKVHIEQHAFIGGFALLYNCTIGHHARVGCGAVVANMDVPPYTTVVGNPAKIVSTYKDGKWVKVNEITKECSMNHSNATVVKLLKMARDEYIDYCKHTDSDMDDFRYYIRELLRLAGVDNV